MSQGWPVGTGSTASRLVLLYPWEVQGRHQGVCHVVSPKRVQSGITEHSSQGNWWRNLGWETFLMTPPRALQPPTSCQHHRRSCQGGTGGCTAGTGAGACSCWWRNSHLRVPARAAGQVSHGCGHLRGVGGYGRDEGDVCAPALASSADLQEGAVGSRAGRDLVRLWSLACLSGGDMECWQLCGASE